METEFTAVFQARWADMDFNGHMKNTAYLDYAADTRMLFFKERGFPMSAFARLHIGPVVFSDQLHYYSELFMYETFEVALRLRQINSDGSRFTVINLFTGSRGKKVATVESSACWLDLKERKITAPPAELFSTFSGLRRHTDAVSGQALTTGSG